MPTTIDKTYTIINYGDAPLELTGTPKVALSGANAADFSVTSQPSSPVAANGGTAEFTIRFNPSGSGERSATVTIENNDPDRHPFTFAIQGFGASGGGDLIVHGAGFTNDECSDSATLNNDFTLFLVDEDEGSQSFEGSPFEACGESLRWEGERLTGSDVTFLRLVQISTGFVVEWLGEWDGDGEATLDLGTTGFDFYGWPATLDIEGA